MHDLDRTLGRTQMEAEHFFEFNAEQGETYGEHGQGETFEFQGEQQEVFGEAEINELAAELLSVSSEQELNQFLGDLIKKAGSAINTAVKSPLGQQLGGMLKSAARTALPVVGSAIGNAIVPGIGGAVGGKLASMAGSMFGLETEGLSQEDRQFEVAKQFVRFGGDATQKAVTATSQGTPPAAAAAAAVQQAAERFIPGLLAKPAAAGELSEDTSPIGGPGSATGNKIIIHLTRE